VTPPHADAAIPHSSVVLASSFLAPPAASAETESMRNGPTYIGGFVGSTLGSFVPALWGAGQLSMASIVCFVIGGFAGIWLAYRLLA
jgi:hypothetical protein